MNLKRTLIKLTAALALVFTGGAVVSQGQASTVAAASARNVNKQVVVNYVAGYSIKSWKSYKKGAVHGNATGNSYKHGTTLNVTGQVTYKKQVWYRLGDKEWVLKRYTLTTAQWAKKAEKAKKAAKAAANKAAKAVANKAAKVAANKAAKAVANKAAKTAANKAAKVAANKAAKVAANKAAKVAANKAAKAAANKAAKQKKVVALAESEVGKPYVWGATGPYSFDCSGLTSYVYKHALGKNITRTTYTQVYQGKRVAVSAATLKKGDLLFWGPASSPYHVGIYVGGGRYVHAATPSQGVIKQSLSYYFWPSTAKRII